MDANQKQIEGRPVVHDRKDALLTETLDLAKAGQTAALDLLQPGGIDSAVVSLTTGSIACTATKKVTLTLQGALSPDAEADGWKELLTVTVTGDEQGAAAPIVREMRCPYGPDVRYLRLSATPGTGATVSGTATLRLLV